MRPLRRPRRRDALDARTRRYLARKTRQARLVQPHAPWIKQAWKTFRATAARRRIDQALDAFSFAKCAYCEQVDAKDIEHFKPQSLYPSKMFAWENFLRSCSTCNNAKLHRFPLDPTGGRFLIEPCEDDPADYFEWDFLSGATGLNSHPDRFPRAATTRDVLQLDRESIRDERRVRIETVIQLLELVVLETPVPPKLQSLLKSHLSIKRPYLGIVRQLFLRPPVDHRDLILDAQAKLPEMRTWVAPWL